MRRSRWIGSAGLEHGLTLGSVPCEGYLCPLNANTFGIEFLKFEIKEYDTNTVVYQVRAPQATMWPGHAYLTTSRAATGCPGARLGAAPRGAGPR